MFNYTKGDLVRVTNGGYWWAEPGRTYVVVSSYWYAGHDSELVLLKPRYGSITYSAWPRTIEHV